MVELKEALDDGLNAETEFEMLNALLRINRAQRALDEQIRAWTTEFKGRGLTMESFKKGNIHG
jgi:hypothetical protein